MVVKRQRNSLPRRFGSLQQRSARFGVACAPLPRNGNSMPGRFSNKSLPQAVWGELTERRIH